MDGEDLSDLDSTEDVDLFIGFGGAVYRQWIADEVGYNSD